MLFALTPKDAYADIMAPFVMSLSESAVVLLPVIIVVESLVLWRFGPVPLWRATWLALVINLASTLLGVVLGLLGMPFPAVLIDFALVPLYFVATVAVEGRLLCWLAGSLARPYRLSFRMNVVSYLILVVGGVYFAHEQDLSKREQREHAFLNRARFDSALPPAPDAAVP